MAATQGLGLPASAARPGLLDGLDAVPGRGGADPSFTVRGGPTSIHANLADLEWGSLLLHSATDEALALSLRAGGWGGLLGVAVQHTTVAAGLQSRISGLSAGLLAISTESHALFLGVQASALAYREAEAAAQLAVAKLVGPAAFGTALAIGLTGEPLPVPLTELAIQGAPDVIAGLLGTVSRGLGSGFVIASDIAGHRARDAGVYGPMSGAERLWPLATSLATAGGVVQLGPVRATKPVPPADDWEESWTPAGTGPMTNFMDHLDLARDAGPGSLQITRLTPDGPGSPDVVWLVALPGTQTGDFRDEAGWSTNPWDMGGNAEALALDSQHVAKAVGEALRDAGAGPDDALVLTGYSQGGIHAARIAADPRITAAYDVQGLVTIGSPTGEIRIPGTVETVHLEHDQDLPAAADGTANPQTASRATITVSGYREELFPDGKDVMSGHSFENYRYHAGRLEHDPQVESAVPSLGHLGALAAGGGVTRTIQLERQRPGPPRNPLVPGPSPGDQRRRESGTVVRPGRRSR